MNPIYQVSSRFTPILPVEIVKANVEYTHIAPQLKYNICAAGNAGQLVIFIRLWQG